MYTVHVVLSFDAQHGIQEVVCMSDMRCDETMALQKQAIFSCAPLFPLAHAKGLQQPTTGAPSVFIQEDLA